MISTLLPKNISLFILEILHSNIEIKNGNKDRKEWYYLR